MSQAPAVKIASDIDYIEASARIVADTLTLVGKQIKAGVKTIELEKIAEDFILSRGGRPAFKGYRVGALVFPYCLCISVEDEVVHGMPGDVELQEGQIVSVDCGVEKDGFFGDSARTFAVGAISEEKQRLLDVTKESLYLGLAQAVARKKVYNIAGAVQRHVEKNGFSVVRDLVGHGIGRRLHEEPALPNFVPPLLHRAQYPNVKLRVGQALAIEPMVNIGTANVTTDDDGWTVRSADRKPSAHFEHTVIVQEREPLILTEE